MIEHTKEPWVAHGAFYPHGVKGDILAKDARDVYDATPICRVVAPVTRRQSKDGQPPIDALHATVRRKDQASIIEANARRIVDCVNALAGLNPSGVAALIEAAEKLNSVLMDAPMYGHISEGTVALINDRMRDVEAAIANIRGDG